MMKWLFWLLLLLNAALFGYFKLTEPHPVGIVAGHEPIQPEKLKILSPEQLSALSKTEQPTAAAPVDPPGAVQTACYEWGSFSATNLSRARNILEKFSLESVTKQTAPQEAARYWVYIPPRKTAEEAQTKANELRALGVDDFFVVQEPQWRYAISLGVFKDEKLAAKHLEDLHTRGVRSAVKSERNHEGSQSSLFMKNVAANVADEIGKLKPDFPGSELKQVTCE